MAQDWGKNDPVVSNTPPSRGSDIYVPPAGPTQQEQARLGIEQERLALERERLRMAQAEEARKQQEFDAKQAKTGKDVADVRAELQNVIDKARQAKQLSDRFFATGFAAEQAAGIGGTAAADVAALLDTIGGNVAFSRLSQMRAESPTGGALGNVTEKELALLQSTVASLKQSQSDEQFKRSMDDVIKAYERILNKLPATEGAQSAAAAPIGTGLRVAEGEEYSTDTDIALARRLSEAWQSGAPIEQLNAISVEVTGSPLSQQALDTLAVDPDRKLSFTPARSGKREGGAPGAAAAIGAGLLKGYTGNLAEEAAGLISPDAAAKLQAAGEYAQEQAPVTTFLSELAGGVLSPLARLPLGKAGTVAGEAMRGAAYGGLYGAGEAAPGASISDRVTGAAIGATTGGAGGALAGRFMGRAAPEGAAPEVPPAAAAAPDAAPVAAAPVAAGEMEAIVDLARKATGSGPGNRAAKRELAKMAKINPAAQEAADRLGVSLPPDVLSDNAQLLSLTGLARSQVGSEAETAWIKASRDAIERSEEALAELGAQKGLAEVSEAVSQKINATMTGLETQASALRKEVDAALDPQGRVEATNLQRSLASVINDLGGIDEAKQAMSGEERKLLAMLGEGETAKAPTYARLNLIRDQIGEALNKGRGPWVDTAERNLRKYYGALAEDQIQHIERVGGKEIADKQRAANSLFRDMYEKRQELVNLFGRDLDKGLAPLIRRVVTTGAKGDTAALNKALANIPKDMHGKVLMSGILAESMGRGGMGGFSFNNFAKTYRGLRENPTIYKQVAKAIGPKGDQTLIDLYAISRRMVEAENKVLKTGKANQALIGQLNADALLKKVIKGPATRLTSVTVGASAGDVTGAAAGSVINEIIERAGGTVRSDKLHRLLASDEFRGLMEKVALGEATDSAANKLAGSKSFIEYAKGLPIPKDFKSRAAWIKSAFSQTGANAAPEPQTIQLEARQ